MKIAGSVYLREICENMFFTRLEYVFESMLSIPIAYNAEPRF